MEARTRYRERLNGFFGVLNEKLEAHRTAALRLERFLSTRFNVFDLIQPGEVKLSALIADMLDPRGVHGQGERFLGDFVRHVGLDDLRNFVPTKVQLEMPTIHLPSTTRFIDVMVHFDGFSLAIENKKWSPEQERQVPDYLSELQGRYPGRHCLVFLTPNGRAPDSMDEGALEASLSEGRLRLLSYQQGVLKWLEDCIGSCESDKYRWFLRDFLDHVSTEFPSPPPSEVLDVIR